MHYGFVLFSNFNFGHLEQDAIQTYFCGSCSSISQLVFHTKKKKETKAWLKTKHLSSWFPLFDISGVRLIHAKLTINQKWLTVCHENFKKCKTSTRFEEKKYVYRQAWKLKFVFFFQVNYSEASNIDQKTF